MIAQQRITEEHQIFRQANDPDTPEDILIKLSKSKNDLIRVYST